MADSQSAENDARPMAGDYEAERGAGICRTCVRPIWWETGAVGHHEKTGWSDRIKRGGDSLVCFSAIEYRHKPLEGREAAIYDAGFKAGQQTRPIPPGTSGDR